MPRYRLLDDSEVEPIRRRYIQDIVASAARELGMPFVPEVQWVKQDTRGPIDRPKLAFGWTPDEQGFALDVDQSVRDDEMHALHELRHCWQYWSHRHTAPDEAERDAEHYAGRKTGRLAYLPFWLAKCRS